MMTSVSHEIESCFPETTINPSSEEQEFYELYHWSLNVCPSVKEVKGFLRAEIARLDTVAGDWRKQEVVTNVYLLACAISDSVDDWLLGERYDFSKVTGALPAGELLFGPVERILNVSTRRAGRRVKELARWRDRWEAALQDYLAVVVAGQLRTVDNAASSLLQLLGTLILPDALGSRRCRIPAAFRSQDLTHFDVLSLSTKFAQAIPEHHSPILVMGCRTAGSYFAPLLRAGLQAAGFSQVDSITIRPKRGLSGREQSRISAIAAKSGLVAVIDEPVNTGSTLVSTVGLLAKYGISQRNIVVLFPIHPNGRNWADNDNMTALAVPRFVTLDPEEWHKHRNLEEEASHVLRSCFERDGQRVNSISQSVEADQSFAAISDQKFHDRLKRVYTIQLVSETGRRTTRFVLAKSVGWGWLGYHAFLAGRRLAGLVPPVVGLRNGILYTEWLSQPEKTCRPEGRNSIAPVAAAYIATRALQLKLDPNLVAGLVENSQHKGMEELTEMLSRAYGAKVAAVLSRPRVLATLLGKACPFPTLIDGKMRPEEWIAGPSSIVKADFEHHGQGKTEMNNVDPAFDLADTILQWNLDESQENELLARYGEISGDATVRERLCLNKLLAGAWAKSRCLDNLKDPRLHTRHVQFSDEYVRVFDFLTDHTTRHCGSLCIRPERRGWGPRVVVSDVDGVLDKQIFGFPSTTFAGMRAISLVHAHGLCLVLNTARCLSQVKEYVKAYGGVGGIAEYGAVVWDAIGERERVLVTSQSLDQVRRLKAELRKIPGVFLNDSYQYSIRAFVYEKNVTAPLPKVMIQDLLAGLQLDRLSLHQTFVDSTVIPREIDKGRGLMQLLELAGRSESETFAIGDSSPDLAMFRVADHSYAPGHISCRASARLLGCRIAAQAWQPGLLDSIRAIVHPDGRQCEVCRRVDTSLDSVNDLFVEFLKLADQPGWKLLLRAALDPMCVKGFYQ